MTLRKKLIIVWHSRTGAAEQMSQAALAGAQAVCTELQTTNLQLVRLPAQQVQASDLLHADAYLFCAPENLAALSGEMKACFDRHYYDLLDQCNGRLYGLIIAAGTDGQGAAAQAERMCTGWRLRAVAPPLIIRNGAQTPADILAPKHVPDHDLARCHELGATLAALLA